MNAFISLVVLVLYPFIAIRRYFEYKYTKPKLAQDLLRSVLLGILSFLMAYFTVRLYLSLISIMCGVTAFIVFFEGMYLFAMINLKLRNETPA